MPSFSKAPPKCCMISSMATVAVLFAAYAGLSVERICSETGISPDKLMNPEDYLSEIFFERFFALLSAAFPGRNVALEIARLAPFSYLGTPGRLLLRSPDLRAMLELFSKHCDSIADRLSMKLVEGPVESVFRAYQPLSDIDSGMSAEIGLGMGARIAQEYFGNDALVRMQFFHKPTGPLSAYEEFFKVPVVFQAEHNDMIFSSKALAWPSRAELVESRERVERCLVDWRKKHGLYGNDFLGKTRHQAMRNALKNDYSVPGLAQSMNMSASCLQRKLRPFGISAGKLIIDLRKVNAEGLLFNDRFSIDEVAEKLGFESERGFRKAFRRWYGMSPAEKRREMKERDMPSQAP